MATRIIVIADEAWTLNAVHAALTEPDFQVVQHEDPATVGELLDGDVADALVVDLQVASMGGMAIAREIHQQAALAGKEDMPVVLLLDRKADEFIAKRAGVSGSVVKPFTAHELRTAVDNAIAR